MLPNNHTRWSRFDLLLILIIAAAVIYLGYRIEAGLEYRWNWQVIPQYLFRFDDEGGGWVPNLLIQGLMTTIRLSFWSLVLALPVGLVAGLLRISLHLFNRMLGGWYVNLFRNMPPLVLILICYYFISDQILPQLGLTDLLHAAPQSVQQLAGLFLAPVDQLEVFLAAVATLALYEGAYIAEIVRAGIGSIESGQWQAGQALGMRRWQVLLHIVLPQAYRRMIPPLAGQFISTIKDSAIVSVISLQELTFQGMELMAATYLTFEVWISVAVLYFLLTYACSWLAGVLEQRMRRAYLF